MISYSKSGQVSGKVTSRVLSTVLAADACRIGLLSGMEWLISSEKSMSQCYFIHKEFREWTCPVQPETSLQETELWQDRAIYNLLGIEWDTFLNKK
jgi:hypothetical protein